MKKLYAGFIAILFLASCVAQKPEQIIKEANVARIIKTLSSDEMEGRGTFTPCIDRAAKFIENEFPNDSITIISQDSDFYQLINDKISVLNINGEEETSRILSSDEINLWFKIINGQKSNNVPPIKFKIEFLKEFLGNDYDNESNNDFSEQDKKFDNPSEENENFRELTKKELYIVLHNLSNFKSAIENNSSVIENNQLNINKEIIDFNYIPQKIASEIINSFWTEYNNLLASNEHVINMSLPVKISENTSESNDKHNPTKEKKKDKIKSNNIFSLLEVED
jgi:hypothetical protein